MPINILMPALSPTMEKGNLAKWLKKEGDKVKSGDVIAEIETDKATMEVEAVDEGTIAKILVPEGTQDVAVNDVIAVMAGDGEDVKAAGAGAVAQRQRQRKRHSKACRGACWRACAKTRGSGCRATSGRACAASGREDQRPRPHLLLAAGAPARQGRRHRSRSHQRHRPARPHHRPRRRGSEIRQGPEGAGRSARGHACDRAVDDGQADPFAVRAGKLRDRAA